MPFLSLSLFLSLSFSLSHSLSHTHTHTPTPTHTHTQTQSAATQFFTIPSFYHTKSQYSLGPVPPLSPSHVVSPVWPDVAIKVAQTFTKVAQNLQTSFYFKSYVFQTVPKSHYIYWANFVRNLLPKTLDILVTLVVVRNCITTKASVWM